MQPPYVSKGTVDVRKYDVTSLEQLHVVVVEVGLTSAIRLWRPEVLASDLVAPGLSLIHPPEGHNLNDRMARNPPSDMTRSCALIVPEALANKGDSR